jgi:putative inorganic carbon (HCO3(-)) transporter
MSLSQYPFTFWTVLLCAAAYLLEGIKLRRWTFVDTLLGVFTVIVVVASFTAYQPDYAFSKLPDYYTWIIIYALITLVVCTEERFLVFITLYLIYCLKMSQFGARKMLLTGFSFEAWGTSCAPAFFQNSGECGIQMAMYFPTAWFFIAALMAYWGKHKRWFFYAMPISTILTIVATSSRGALLSIGVVAVWMIAQTRHRVRSLCFLGMAAAVVWVVMVPKESKERFHNIGEDSTSVYRFRHWEKGLRVMNDHPVLGIGYYSWQPYHRGAQLPHNIFIQAGAELGYPGLFCFIALIVANFIINRKTRRLARRLTDGAFLANMAKAFDGALIGFIVGGYFVTVLYYPFFWINLAMSVALYNSTLNELKRMNGSTRRGVPAPAFGRRARQ